MLEPIVASQIAICLVLLAATAALLLQLLQLRSRHVGFHGVHVLPMRLFLAERYGKNAERLGRYQDAVVTRVGSLPGVEQAAFVSYLPTGDSGRRPFVGVGTGRELSGNLLSATPSTFGILGIPIERGRDFKAGDAAAFRGVVIAGSSLAAGAWPDQGPVGRHLPAKAVSEEPLDVMGVVVDVGSRLTKRAIPIVYRPYRRQSAGTILLVRTAGTSSRRVSSTMRVRSHEPGDAIRRAAR